MNPIMIRYPVMRFSRASIMRTGKSCPIFRHASSTSLLAFCYHCAIIAHENSESIRVFSDNERRHLDQQPPISDIASQLTRFNDPMLAPVPFLSSPRLSSFTPLPPSPGFFFITSPLHSYRNVGKKAKHRSVIRYITLSGSQVLSGVIDVYPPERVRAGGRRDRGGGRREGGGDTRGMDGQRGRCGPYAAQYVQHSLTGTVQSSTRGLSSRVHHPPFAPTPVTISPVPPFLPHRSSRPLTFYHHNRYIIPRSVFYSRVTPWNAFVRDIVPPLPLLTSPPSSWALFFFPRPVI